jgi:hypothetical protein
MRRPALFCALGAVAMAVALQRSSGMYELPALLLATFAAACALAAAPLGAKPERNLFWVQAVLGAGFLYGLYCHLFESPGFYANPSKLGGFRGLALVAVLCGSAYLCVHLRASLQKARFLLLLLVFALMGVAMIRASPGPRIDVFVFRQMGANALSHGLNPYSITFPNLYPREPFYAPDLVRNARVLAYPYLPLTALLDRLTFGDVRYISLLLMLIAAWAMGRFGLTGELAAMAMLFQGRSFFVLEQAWTEPLVLAAFTVASWLASRQPSKNWPHWLGFGLSIGVLAASKQYSPLLVLPLWIAAPGRLRTALMACAVVLLTIAPFWIWDREGFLRGAVYMQFWQPLRADSLSWLVFWARRFGQPAFALLPSALAAAAALALGVRFRSSPGRMAATAAAAWILFVLFNKQAFCNYDWLGGGLLCAAAAGFSREVAS